MEFEEARAYFYNGEWDEDDSGQEWEPDMARVRGAILKWAREQDSIRGYNDEPDMMALEDSIKDWFKERLGDGVHAVIRTHDYNRAGFERVSKERLARQANSMLDSQDEFCELVEDKWVEIVPDLEPSSDESPAEEYIQNNDGGSLVADFFNGTPQDDINSGLKSPEPRVKRFKYFMKRYVMETKAIPADGDEPTAEELTELWVEWLWEQTNVESGFLVREEKEEPIANSATVYIGKVEEWCRELWVNDEMFKEHVKLKWGQGVNGEEVDEGKRPELEPMSRPDSTKRKQNQGQTGIGDWG